MSILEGDKDKPNLFRHLYAPPDVVDYDTMYQHGVKLNKLDCSVWVHEHRLGESCEGVTPSGVTRRCVQLTSGSDEPKLVSEQASGSQTTK
jgi:hypothetical protein